jgi:DNA polymerase-3 subunit delta'
MPEYRPYPWQQLLWAGLVERLKAGRLPHALLLSGPQGMGKRHFADGFALAMLCESPMEDNSACGVCRSCLLVAAGSHPDYLRVEPEEEGKVIGIDAVRKATKFQALKSQHGRQRVIQLQPADRLNANAANALLKTLEEPVGDTVLLLTTDRPMALLPTIRSRCQQVIFRPVDNPSAELLAWLTALLPADSPQPQLLLQMAGGAPLSALSLITEDELTLRQTLFDEFTALEQGTLSPLKLAERWMEQGAQRVLPWLYHCLADMVKLKMVPNASRLTNPMLRPDLQALAEKVDLYFLQALLLRVQERTGLLRGQANQQVIMEELLLAWKQRRV